MRSCTRFFLTVFLLPWVALGFTNAYVSFEHPEGWKCELAQGVFVCQSGKEVERKQSVVLTIATEATEWDSLDNFEAYLKQARANQDEQGKEFKSEVRYVRKRNINGQVWVDSLQYNSELPGFWARYVATVHTTPKVKLAILITYIVSDENYKKLAPEFERMVSSLKPNDEIDMNIASKQGDLTTLGADRIGPIQKDIIRDRLAKKPEEPPAAEVENSNGLMPLAVVAVVAVGGIIVVRKRKKKKAA